jgi:hypothetical protein
MQRPWRECRNDRSCTATADRRAMLRAIRSLQGRQSLYQRTQPRTQTGVRFAVRSSHSHLRDAPQPAEAHRAEHYGA